MITDKNVISISQMRKETESVLDKVKNLGQPVYLFSRSQIKAVLLNPEEFAKMQELIENYHDQRELLGVTEDELKQAEDWNKVKAKV